MRLGNNVLILRWKNTVGGLESFNFNARKTYGYNIRNAQVAEKDIFADWDANFVPVNTDHTLVDITAARTVIIRTPFLTAQQAEGIARIKFSPWVFDTAQALPVRIDRNSFRFRTDDEKLIELEFTINYPNEIVPTI